MSKRERKPSHKWATLQECADHFCVSTTTIRLGRGVFARLRRTALGQRTLVLRADFMKLDRELERAAVDLTGNLTDILEGRQ